MPFNFDKTIPFIVFSMAYLACASVFTFVNELEAWAIAAALIAYAFLAHSWAI